MSKATQTFECGNSAHGAVLWSPQCSSVYNDELHSSDEQGTKPKQGEGGGRGGGKLLSLTQPALKGMTSLLASIPG